MAMLIRIVGVLLMCSALAIPLLRAPDRPVETLVARWGQPPSEFMDLDGQLVHYRDEGPKADATPIVLIHGTSASLHTWDGWTQALKSQRRVIRFDLPAFGLTGPHPNNDYSIASYIHVVMGVVDQLGVGQFVLAGNSLGGQIAWGAALAHPQRVGKLVLVDVALDEKNSPGKSRDVELFAEGADGVVRPAASASTRAGTARALLPLLLITYFLVYILVIQPPRLPGGVVARIDLRRRLHRQARPLGPDRRGEQFGLAIGDARRQRLDRRGHATDQQAADIKRVLAEVK